MKVFAVYECLISGGLDRLLIHLIKCWPQSDTQWTLYCHQKNSGLALMRKELGSKVNLKTYDIGSWVDAIHSKWRSQGRIKLARYFKVLFFPWICFKQFHYFRREIKQQNPDIVYLHQGGYPGAYSEHLAGMAAKSLKKKVKVVVSIQNLPSTRKGSLFARVLDRLVNEYADHLIFATNYTVEEYRQNTGLIPSKMVVVHEGVMVNTDDKKINSTNENVNIGIVGTYERRKGHRVLFDALKQLQSRGVNGFRLHSYGQSEFGEYKEISAYAKNLKIDGLIDWHEYESNYDKLYGPLDIVVNASTDTESMPLVPIDSAAYYKPVVASKLQGTQEVIEHEVTGLLFDVGDSKVLSDQLEVLIKDKEKREQMGEAARKRYEKMFTAQRMANEYCNIFELDIKDREAI